MFVGSTVVCAARVAKAVETRPTVLDAVEESVPVPSRFTADPEYARVKTPAIGTPTELRSVNRALVPFATSATPTRRRGSVNVGATRSTRVVEVTVTRVVTAGRGADTSRTASSVPDAAVATCVHEPSRFRISTTTVVSAATASETAKRVSE